MMARGIAAAALLGLLTACGWVEVEPEERRQARPAATTPAPVRIEAGRRYVVVRDGDTLFGLANRYDATRRQLIND